MTKEHHSTTDKLERCCKACSTAKPATEEVPEPPAETPEQPEQPEPPINHRVAMRDARRSQHGLPSNPPVQKRPTAVAGGLAPVAPPPPPETTPTDALQALRNKYTRDQIKKEDPEILLDEEVDDAKVNGRDNLRAYLKKTSTARNVAVVEGLGDHPMIMKQESDKAEETKQRWVGAGKKLKGFLVFGGAAKEAREEKEKADREEREKEENRKRKEKGVFHAVRGLLKGKKNKMKEKEEEKVEEKGSRGVVDLPSQLPDGIPSPPGSLENTSLIDAT